MRWKDGKPGSSVIVTPNGRPGACAAAAVLLKYPGSGIYISSCYHLARCLKSISRHEEVKTVHICGMGFKGSLVDLIEVLSVLKNNGVEVNWYSGNYWNIEIKPKISKYCNTYFKNRIAFDTQVVVNTLKLEKDERVPMLLELSDLSFKPSGLALELSDLVSAGMFRYFQFGDLDSFPTAIRKLSAQFPLSPQDRNIIRRFKAAGQDEGLDGTSPAIRKIKSNLAKYGKLDTINVLILGETGVGKERVARLLHFASPRAEEPFFCENCATLTSEGLINSKLFGHVKGAFTGAVHDTDGILDAADGGVLFLDEIGEMPLDTQAKLLRVMDKGTFIPVGSVHEKKVDVRIIAATNCDLKAMVQQKKFRKDLFYRLIGFVIEVPPLRDRLEDIPRLAGSIRRELEKKHDMSLPQLTPAQVDILSKYSWPGNVRQLYNVLQRAWVLDMMGDLAENIADQNTHIDSHKLIDRSMEGKAGFHSRDLTFSPEEPSDVVSVADVVSEYVVKSLKAFSGNKTKAAKALDISVNTLNKKLSTKDETE